MLSAVADSAGLHASGGQGGFYGTNGGLLNLEVSHDGGKVLSPGSHPVLGKQPMFQGRALKFLAAMKVPAAEQIAMY